MQKTKTCCVVNILSFAVVRWKLHIFADAQIPKQMSALAIWGRNKSQRGFIALTVAAVLMNSAA